MRESKSIIDAAVPEIVHQEVRAFTGRSPLRKRAAGKQGAIVDDLVSAGTEALIRAVDHFEPSLGFTLKTYASRCVRHAIRRAARPRKRDALSRELVRLDAAIQADDGLTTHNVAVADYTIDDFHISEAAWRRIQGLMPNREFDVLAARCVGFTRAEIGKWLGLSAERVRQIGQRALQTIEELYRVNSELRLAIDAPRFYREQMANAQSAGCAYQSSPNSWAYRDGLRQIEAEAGAYREPPDWKDALAIAAKLAMLELGMKLPKPLNRRTENVRQTTSQRWRRNPPRFEEAAGRRGASPNDKPRHNHSQGTRRPSQV
jgi:RNA polymerase sigma factor (sigma-70 family)